VVFATAAALSKYTVPEDWIRGNRGDIEALAGGAGGLWLSGVGKLDPGGAAGA
jgi:hypothetical protein